MQMRNRLRKLICRRAFGRIIFVLAVLLATRASAQDPVAKLTAAVNARDEKTQIQAIDTLARMGPAAKPAIRTLAALLQQANSSPSVRAHAAYALGALGTAAADAADALSVAAAQDSDAQVRRQAVRALSRIHSEPQLAIASLGNALEDPDPAVRVAALDSLTSAGPAAVPVLGKALENPATRYWAALALGELHKDAKPALGALVEAMKDERPEVRREVLVALARIGPDAAAAVPAISALLADPDASARHAAAFALGHIGPQAASAAPLLVRDRQSKDPLMQAVSAWALAHIDPTDAAVRRDAIGLLTQAIRDKNPRVQGAAFRGLIELENDPTKLVPALSLAITESDPSLVHDILSAAASLGESGIPVLIEALKRPEAATSAASLLAGLGSKAKSATPALAAMLGDPTGELRREALLALAAMGADAAPAQAAILKMLSDPELRVRTVAAYALGRIGTDASTAAPQLRAELQSTDPVMRVASAWALVHVSPRGEQVAPEVLPNLMQGLKNENVPVRRGSAEALGRLGKAARTAEGALRVTARDPDETVRKAALEALERMGTIVDGIRRSAVPKR
jgi:HEAT repeat protein